MTYANGRLPAEALTIVQPGCRLSATSARAWVRLTAAAKTELKRTVSIAGPAGAYRSFAVQAAMRAASTGHDVQAKRKWGLSSVSTAPLASAGYSNHGLGVCVDVVGTPMDAGFLTLAKQHGFTRPLRGDPNHFIHDGKTACSPDVAPGAAKAGGVRRSVLVKDGDTLSRIAGRVGTTWQKLATKNGLKAPYVIRAGQKLVLP